jgi:hypothetical protein
MDQVSVFDYALPATGTNSVATLYGGGTAVTNPMSLSPTPVTYYQLGDQSVSTGPTSDYLVPNNSLQDYVFDFDSTNNEYIDCGGANDFSFTNGSGTDLPFSLSAWINMVDASSFRIISKYGSGTDIEWYFYTTGSDILRFRLYDKNNVGYIGRGYSTAMTSYQGQWINVVATYNGNEQSSGIKIYINGLKVDDQDASGGTYEGMTTTTNPVTIGKMGTAYANGKFSNVSIFNTELISTQVETIYNNGAPNDISSLNPAAWYKLNASEIFNNTSTEWSVDNNAYPSVYQSSLNFGTSDYINTNRTVASNLNFSVSAWINPTSHDTVILGTRGLATASTSNGFTMNINSSGNLWGRIFTETSNVTQVQTGGTISLNNWSHVAMTYNSSSKTLKTYLNGSEVGSIIGTDSSVTSTAELNIGRASIGTFYDYFDGEISNTAVFNTELTSNQITTIYNNGTPEAAISHSPTSWYKLNNTTTGIQDSAGSNNGTNNGATEYAGFVNTLAGESVSMDSSNLVVSDLQQTSGYSPYALDFDGVDDYLDFNNASANIMAGKNAISLVKTQLVFQGGLN